MSFSVNIRDYRIRNEKLKRSSRVRTFVANLSNADGRIRDTRVITEREATHCVTGPTARRVRLVLV